MNHKIEYLLSNGFTVKELALMKDSEVIAMYLRVLNINKLKEEIK